MPYLETPDGVPLYYQEEGAGKAIFLIHGGSANSSFWEKQFRGLAPRYRIVALDNRGHGNSGKTDQGHDMGQYARDVHFVLESLGIERVVLVGWSMGGAVTFSYIQQFGNDRLAGLVDIDQKALMWTSEEDLQATFLAVRNRKLQLHKDRVTLFFANPQPQELINGMAYELMKTSASTYCASVEDVWRTDYRPVLPRIHVPTLIFTSVKGLMGEDTAHLMAQSIPDAQVSVFANSGHLLFWEEADRFNQELAEFVERAIL